MFIRMQPQVCAWGDKSVSNCRSYIRGKQALSARGFKRVGRHSEYAIYTVWEVRKKRPRGFE